MRPNDLPRHLTMHGPPLPPQMAALQLARKVVKGDAALQAVHEYTDADGTALYWRIRARKPDGDKVIRPMSVQGMEYELKEPDFGGKGKPLYRLHDVAAAEPSRPIFYVEGEKCADALAGLGVLATTAGGAQSDAKADFDPLRGRKVNVWPDNDDPGRQHGERVAEKLRAIDCTVSIIDIDTLALPKGGDVVDWQKVQPKATADDVIALPIVAVAPQDPESKAADGEAGVDDDADERRSDSVASKLVRFVQEQADLFHDENSDAYARDRSSGQVRRLDGRGFRNWIRAAYFKLSSRSVSEHALSEAIATLSGIALHDGERRRVHVRCAHQEGVYWVDLCEPGSGRAIRIDATGWRVVESADVMFVRFEPMQPLSVPVAGGSIDEIWRLVNIPEDSRLLVLTWLVECLRPDTPFPVLELIGEQGSAKSTTQAVLRRLMDPNGANLRALPKSTEDAFVAAGTQWLVSYENVSHLPAPMQDAFCVLATGGGYAKRKLYSDADESVITVKRPIVLNGISANVTQQDLLDRAICVELPAITDRRDVTVIEKAVSEALPRIFGAILEIAAKALARLPMVDIPRGRRPRLLEFAKLGCAVAEVTGSTAAVFMEQFDASRQDGVARTLDASPVATAVLAWLEKNPLGEVNTAKALYDGIGLWKPDRAENWPHSPKGFADALRRAAPALRTVGVGVRSVGRRGGHFYWSIKRGAGNFVESSPGSPASPAPDQAPGEKQDVRTFRTWEQEVSCTDLEVF